MTPKLANEVRIFSSFELCASQSVAKTKAPDTIRRKKKRLVVIIVTVDFAYPLMAFKRKRRSYGRQLVWPPRVIYTRHWNYRTAFSQPSREEISMNDKHQVS